MSINFLQNLKKFDEIDSTNDYIKQNYKNLPNFSVIQTKYQAKGRGQFERTWESEKNKNLLFSILIKNEMPNLEDINLVFVNSIIETFQEFKISNAIFKYPNDVYVANKKIAGILIEKQYDNKNLVYLVVGIGININQKKFKNFKAISLINILKKETNIDDFLKILFNKISTKISQNS